MKKLHIVLFTIVLAFFVWSIIGCEDFFTWLLEALPVIIGGAIILAIYKKTKLTDLAYILVVIHCVILLVGAHYTYAKMPLFNWLKEAMNLSRNHYDRLGHLAQGFIPAILAREVLIRNRACNGKWWIAFSAISFCGCFTACFEIFEWLIAASTGDKSIAYLATQGDVWDTQKDMLLCIIGAVASILLLSRLHDKQLTKLEVTK